MSKFQIFLLGGFAFIILLSVILFSQYKGDTSDVAANIAIWGDLPASDFSSILAKTSLANNNNLVVSYKEIEPELIDSQFVEALAVGDGPDLVLLPQDKIEKYKNKLILIPYSTFSERQFKDSFISGAEIYLAPEGVVALPFIIDPLVMYWNRSIFTAVNLTEPPSYWDELYNLSQTISVKDDNLNISRSAVAIGEFSNISNAKAIIANLFMQAGTPIVSKIAGKNVSVLAYPFDKTIPPADAAVNFYTQFSNPAKPFYSWNRSLPKSSDYFLSGRLAIYFGFASEIYGIQLKNPNLDFDVAMVPASRDVGVNTSYAKFYGLAISKGSKSPMGAFQVANILSSPEGAMAVMEVLGLPPLRRDMLSVKPTRSFMDVFYRSAIRSKSWLDPDPDKTDAIFRTMIESVTSGRERTSTAVTNASTALDNLFGR